MKSPTDCLEPEAMTSQSIANERAETSLEAREDNSWLVSAVSNIRWQYKHASPPGSPMSVGEKRYLE